MAKINHLHINMLKDRLLATILQSPMKSGCAHTLSTQQKFRDA